MPGVAIQIQTLRDEARPALMRLERGLQRERLFPVIGQSASNTVINHLRGLNAIRPNALGGPRTNFYAGAAGGTHFNIVGDDVIVSINHVGIAQRYFGGTIRPKTAKYLTIPVHPKAYGKKAREMDLELVFGRNGEPIALATKAHLVTIIRQRVKGGITRKLGGRRGEIMFRLVKKVVQQPDPTVLPHEGFIESRAKRDVTEYINRLIERQKDRK